MPGKLNESDMNSPESMRGRDLKIALLLAAVVGDRFGNLRPAVVYSLILVAGVLLLCGTDNFILFSLDAYAYMLAWSGADGYLLAIVADVDPDGRHIALAVPAFGIGSMIGPVLAGYLYSGSSTLWLFVMLLAAISCAVLLAWRSGASNRRCTVS